MTNKTIYSFLLLLLPLFSFGQYVDSLGYYWVMLTEKSDTSYQLENPFEFLSRSAIERRIRQGIPFDNKDLPVDKDKLIALKEKGALIHNTSRWLNAVTIRYEREKIAELEELSFVKDITYVGREIIRKQHTPSKPVLDTLTEDMLLTNFYHGFAARQVNMIGVDALHLLGFRGQGVKIGVADGGFINVDVMPVFKNLNIENTKDFVERDTTVYHSSTHGSKVLSLIASNVPNFFVGTAPEADFTCMKTEDTRGEYRLEECNLIAALEYADSLGVSIVNTSLGYSSGFTEKNMNYVYEQLDGRTAISSQAVTAAFEKGMIMVTSAGNEGNSPWKYVGVPADSPQSFAIGAVDLNGDLGSFSSVGPTADGRIKPDVVAPGASILVPDVSSFKIGFGSGTSYASPIIAGAVACLWQAFPTKTNKEILEAIRRSASNYQNPNNKVGYGLPNFFEAYKILNSSVQIEKGGDK